MVDLAFAQNVYENLYIYIFIYILNLVCMELYAFGLAVDSPQRLSQPAVSLSPK